MGKRHNSISLEEITKNQKKQLNRSIEFFSKKAEKAAEYNQRICHSRLEETDPFSDSSKFSVEMAKTAGKLLAKKKQHDMRLKEKKFELYNDNSQKYEKKF